MPPHQNSRLAKFISLFREDGKLQPGRLLTQDLRFLRLRYKSDWRPFNAVILSSIIFVFCCSIFPALTFANDLYTRTDSHWGPIEVIFSTGLCGTIFSTLSVQPLTIVGVTGPFSVLATNIYSLTQSSFRDADFLPFMAWTLINTGWMLILLAVFNAYEWTMVYVTDFTCEIFGLLTSTVYFNNAVQELLRTRKSVSFAAFLWALVSCVGTFLLALLLTCAPRWPPILGHSVRVNFQRYAVPISFFVWVALGYLPVISSLDEAPLHTSNKVFRPSLPSLSSFFVQFWNLPVVYVFGSALPALIITMLLFFDHNISSIMCTAKRFHTRKPAGLAQPIVLLGITTALCGLLGIPPADGLLPQAPLHSESLLHETREPFPEGGTDKAGVDRVEEAHANRIGTYKTVHEQRYSNLVSAGAILIFVAPPFQKLLSFTPTPVLAGIFLLYAYQTVTTNPILHRLGYMLMPPSQLPPLPSGVTRWRGIHAYTLTQVVLTYGIFGITQSPAGPAFPIIVFALVPLRLKFLSRYWNRDVLRYVDRWSCKDGCPEDDDPPKPPPKDGGEDSGHVIDISSKSRRSSRQLPSDVKESLKRVSRDTLFKMRGGVQCRSKHSSSVYPDGDDISMNVLLSSDNLHPHGLRSSDPRVFKAREWLEDQNEPVGEKCRHPYHLNVPTSSRPKRLSLPAIPLAKDKHDPATLEEGLRRRTPGVNGREEDAEGKKEFPGFGASIVRPPTPKHVHPLSPRIPRFEDEDESMPRATHKGATVRTMGDSKSREKEGVEEVELADVPPACPRCMQHLAR